MIAPARNAFPRAALVAAPDVPEATLRRLRRGLGDGGICLGQAEDLLDGTLPADTPLLALFRRPGPQLLSWLAGVASRPGGRLLGVGIPGSAALPGDDPIEDIWRDAGLRPEDLLLWDGTTPPTLVVARLLDGFGPGAPSASVPDGSVDVVLRTGRVLRVRSGVAPDLLRRLVLALEG